MTANNLVMAYENQTKPKYKTDYDYFKVRVVILMRKMSFNMSQEKTSTMKAKVFF
jgi:hypothetical protein